MTTDPRVRDYTQKTRSLSVSVAASPVFEFLLGLFIYQSRSDDDDFTRDVDPTFFERLDTELSEDVRETLSRLTGCGELWLTLLGVAHTAPEPHTIDGFFDHVAGFDPVELRLQLLENAGATGWSGYDPALVAAAAAGDLEAVEQLMAGKAAQLTRIMRLDPVETRDDLVALMRRIHAESPLDEASVMPALRRDAAANRELIDGMDPSEAVETVTGGVTFAMQPGITGVVLIPSLVIRPWVMISEHDGLRLFAYPVAEQHLTADPAAPPPRLVEMVKALADERRLRILYLLNGGPLTLGQLSDKLELSKSTTHHHVRTLRTAGLVRVVVDGDEMRHEVRGDVIGDLGVALDRYVAGPGNDVPG